MTQILTHGFILLEAGFMTIFGAVYLLSLGLAFGVTLRMKGTVEAIA